MKLSFDNIVAVNEYLQKHRRIVGADIPNEVYHKSNAISHSAIKVMGQSPSKYKWELDHYRPQTPAMALGTAIHMAVLEPDLFENTYRVFPKFDRRTKVGKADAEAWDIENKGKTGVNQDEMDTIRRVYERINSVEKFSALVKTGVREKSYYSTWDDLDLFVRCRPDNFIEEKGIVVDLKTTDSCLEHIFKHDITKYSYMTQAAWYCHVMSIALERDIDTYVILAVEKSKDCDVNAFWFSKDTLDFFLNKFCRKWMTQLDHCIKTDTWPGYEREFIEYTPAKWMLENDE